MSAAEVLAEPVRALAGKGQNAASTGVVPSSDRRPPLPAAAATASAGGRGAAEGERRRLLRMASSSALGLARALGLLAAALERGGPDEALTLGRDGAQRELEALRAALHALHDHELDRVFTTIAWAIERPEFPPSDAREFSRLLEGASTTLAHQAAEARALEIVASLEGVGIY